MPCLGLKSYNRDKRVQSLSRGVCGYEVWGGAPESPLSMGPERPRYATAHHVNMIATRANKALWFIRRNLWWCPKSVKQQMYFVRGGVDHILSFSTLSGIPLQYQHPNAGRNTAWVAQFMAKDYRRTSSTVTNIFQELQMVILRTTKATDPAVHHV